jgi:hypothetical protein
MADIVLFKSENEQRIGVVIYHSISPLDDFYIIYSEYALHKSYNTQDNASIILDNVIIPACDAAIADYMLKRQHIRDMMRAKSDIEALIEAIIHKMDIDSNR